MQTIHFLKHCVLSLGLMALGGLYGCQGQTPFIQGFSYTVQDSVLGMTLRFNKSMALNTDLAIPVMHYGTINLISSTPSTGFGLGATLDMNTVNDGRFVTFDKTQRLPNAQIMPSYVTTPLARLRIKAPSNVFVDLYLGLEDVDHFYVGIAVEFELMDQEFPAALVLTQTINDQASRPLGTVSIFGPNVAAGQVVSSGGFFVVTNASDLAKYVRQAQESNNGKGLGLADSGVYTPPLKNVDKTEVNIQKYQDQGEQFKLYNLFQDKARQAGF